MSDTVSVNSSQSGGGGDSAHAGIVVEEVGKITENVIFDLSQKDLRSLKIDLR